MSNDKLSSTLSSQASGSDEVSPDIILTTTEYCKL